jgi:DNA-binding CsgD family transcriptional regulator
MLVGRSRELDRIEALLGGARTGRPGVLVIRGEAGIGKTALLECAAEAAHGFRVLRTTGVESEAELGSAGLHQLLHPLVGHLDELPGPQAAALRAAFALDAMASTDRFAIYAGTLGLIAAAAEAHPLLCLIDDAHWLDSVSAEALVFAARRLQADAVVMLFSARPEAQRSFTRSGLPTLELAGLDASASAELIAANGRPVGTFTVKTLMRVAGGNPLALLELPRGLSDEQLLGSAPLEDPVRVSGVIEAAFLARVRELSLDTRRVLLLAAASEPATTGTMLAAGGTRESLAAAEHAGLVHVQAETIVFRHPLVRAAVYHAATGSERREAHAALASVLRDDAELRAWHLAAAAAGPDEHLAAVLEQTADRAARRGSMATRARALTRAAELTPTRSERGRRLLDAADAAWLAGQTSHAAELLDQAAALVEDPPRLADLALARARIVEGQSETLAVVAAAQAVERCDPHRAASMLCWAHDYMWDTGDMEKSRALVERGWELVGRTIGPDTVAIACAVAWQWLSDMRVAESLPLARQSIEAAVAMTDAESLYHAAFLAEMLVYAEDSSARAALAKITDRAQELGALHCLCWAQIARSELELRESRFTAAYAAAAEALTLGELLGDYQTSHAAGALAHVDAMIGRADDCRRHADLAIERAPGNVWVEAVARRARGVLALSTGHIDIAVRELDAATSLVAGVQHPGFLDCHLDHAEALLRAGKADRAAALLAELESRATETGLHRTVAAVRRGGALAVSNDSLDDAFLGAVRSAERASPLDEARARLCYGERLRRVGRRADARAQLRSALATCEQLGAEPWAEHARRELRASGATLRRDPLVREQLTPQELQIAATVAEGKTNREVGAAYFISPKTVEVHLSRVYRKLGIHSRSELIRLRSAQKWPGP